MHRPDDVFKYYKQQQPGCSKSLRLPEQHGRVAEEEEDTSNLPYYVVPVLYVPKKVLPTEELSGYRPEAKYYKSYDDGDRRYVQRNYNLQYYESVAQESAVAEVEDEYYYNLQDEYSASSMKEEAVAYPRKSRVYDGYEMSGLDNYGIRSSPAYQNLYKAPQSRPTRIPNSYKLQKEEADASHMAAKLFSEAKRLEKTSSDKNTQTLKVNLDCRSTQTDAKEDKVPPRKDERSETIDLESCHDTLMDKLKLQLPKESRRHIPVMKKKTTPILASVDESSGLDSPTRRYRKF